MAKHTPTIAELQEDETIDAEQASLLSHCLDRRAALKRQEDEGDAEKDSLKVITLDIFADAGIVAVGDAAGTLASKKGKNTRIDKMSLVEALLKRNMDANEIEVVIKEATATREWETIEYRPRKEKT